MPQPHREPRMIFNGGDPIGDCPRDWKWAKEWEDRVNKSKSNIHEPNWKFDCGFKLDFDGPLLNISSRFYPPKTGYGPGWDGVVHIILLGETIKTQKFETKTLEQLHAQVKAFVISYSMKIKSSILK